MKRTLLFTLLFYLYFTSTAQNLTLLREIRWKEPHQISQYYEISQKNLDTKKFLFFENAHYYNHNTLLPYYYEIINVNALNAKVKITNLQFEPLSKNELANLQYPDSLPEKLFYESQVKISRGQPFLQFNLLPLRRNTTNNQLEKLISFHIEIVTGTTEIKTQPKESKAFTNQSVLRNGKWSKIRIKETGIYKITYNQLSELGIENPAKLKIYGNSQGMLPLSNTEEPRDDLVLNAIYFEKGSDGIFNQGDYILFYAEGPDQWVYNESDDFYSCIKHIYSDYNYFFITSNNDANNEIIIVNNPSEPPGEIVTSFTDYLHYENESKNLIESGQLWVGETFDITTSFSFDFTIHHLIKTEPVKIKTALVARSSSTSSFTIRSGAQSIASLQFDPVNVSSYTSTYAIRNITENDFTSNNDNFSVDIDYNKPSPSSIGWLDFITLNAQRQLYMSGNQLK